MRSVAGVEHSGGYNLGTMIPCDLSSHTMPAILNPLALPADVHRVVTDVMQQGCMGVIVPPVWVARVATMLRAHAHERVTLGCTVAYPHGTAKSTVKAIEATSAVKDGADELIVAPLLANLLRADVNAAKQEFMEIVRAARAARRDVQIHVILGVPLLDREALIAAACQAVREGGCDGVVIVAADPKRVGLIKRQTDALTVIALHQAPAAGGIADSVAPLVSAGAERVIVEIEPAQPGAF